MDYDSEGKSFYDGDWVNNVKHGWGMRQYASGNVYQGMWFNNCRHGEGTMKWIDRNQIYTGNWENGIQVVKILGIECSKLGHFCFVSMLYCNIGTYISVWMLIILVSDF